MAGKTQFANGGGNDAAILNRYYNFPGLIGNALFVNSALTLGPGYSPDAPFTTLAAAVAAASASNGDVIFLAPGHSETYVGAAGVTVNVAGLRIQGMGIGRNRPTFNFTTSTAAQMIFSAANLTISNCVFDLTGVNAIIAALSVIGADITFEDCEFILSTGTNAPLIGILTAATATRFGVERCRFVGPATSSSTVTACIKHEVGVDWRVKNCFFKGKIATPILNATAVLGGLIDNNVFHTYGANVGISAHASSTGVVSNNTFVVAAGTAPCIGTILSYVNNHYTTEGIGVVAGSALTF